MFIYLKWFTCIVYQYETDSSGKEERFIQKMETRNDINAQGEKRKKKIISSIVDREKEIVIILCYKLSILLLGFDMYSRVSSGGPNYSRIHIQS